MDRSDVEMDDTTKQPQGVENGAKRSQNDAVDGHELPHFAAGEHSKPCEVGPAELIRTHDVQTPAKMEVELLKNLKSKVEDPNNVKSKAKKVGEDVNNLKNETTYELEDQSNIKSGAEVQIKIQNESKEEILIENGVHDGNPGENIVEDQKPSKNPVVGKKPSEKGQLSVDTANEVPHTETGAVNEVRQSKDEAKVDDVGQTSNGGVVNDPKDTNNKTASATAMADGDAEMGEMPETKMDGGDAHQDLTEGMLDVPKEPVNKIVPAIAVVDGTARFGATTVTNREVDDSLAANHHEPTTTHVLVKCQTTKAGSQSRETYRNVFNEPKMHGDEDGAPEEQAAFMRELESFYRERAMEFKPPRFYGQQLNLLKLWRSVIRLGGYDWVTRSKLWRQVGESFHPPKTCTTVSWTFRIFYEKALLEYERNKRESGELKLPPHALPDPSVVDNEGNGYQASGSGRARRDAAARAMQGWHARLFGDSEVGEPVVKDKNVNNMPNREKNLKSIGSLKQKRPHEMEYPVKEARTETSRRLVASVDDVGPPADWVKINVCETKDFFEVYALVPGLLREEVRVQSDPAGRLVITGQPEQPDNPWGITPFKKVVSLPARIDPLQTSAVVSLHGRLYVRVPFEHPNI